MQRIFLLKGKVQHYDWGGHEFIPQLLNIENADQKPYAEYWLGAHPNLSGEIEYLNTNMPLREFIHANIKDVLGAAVAEEFDSLPFLFKVLDVRQMLSIQLHPHKESAKVGYDREEELNIPIDADYRNYKDRNHKPEMMIALSDFWLLHGFRPPDQVRSILHEIPEFRIFQELFSDDNYEELCNHVLTMSQHEVNQTMSEVAKRIASSYSSETLQKDNADFWAAKALAHFYKEGDYDRGIFFIYILNLVHLKTGEAVFQPSQMLHCYLEGKCIEVMANSDNVLRAGLSSKYVDATEVLKRVNFQPTNPRIINKPDGEDQVYKAIAEEFEVIKYLLEKDAEKQFISRSAEIIFILNGSIQLTNNTTGVTITKGQSAFIVAGTEYKIVAEESSEIFRVCVPVRKQQTHDNHS